MKIAQGDLHRDTLADQVARRLIAYMDEQSLRSGDVLPSEAALAGDFQVSRATIREALRYLEAQGVVETANGKRSQVGPVSSDLLHSFFSHAVRVRRKSVVELMEIRKGIEVQSASLAAMRRSSEELDDMQRQVTEMRRHVGQSDRYTALDAGLHLAIASASRNELLYRLLAAIREPIEHSIRTGLLSRTSGEEWTRVQELHEQLVEAIREYDPRLASDVMARHFDDAVSALVHEEGARDF